MESQQLIFWDLYENPNQNLLHTFYQDFMIPYFPLEEERDPVESWERLLSEETKKDRTKPVWRLILALDSEDKTQKRILAGGACEYYPQSNCVLFSYLVVHADFRQQGIAKKILQKELEIISKDVKKRFGKERVDALFAEMNSPERIEESRDVMNPTARLSIFQKLGFQKLDFEYIQPPLSPQQQKCKDLLLSVYPGTRLTKEGSKLFLDGKILKKFLYEFYRYFCRYDFEKDEDFRHMMDQIARKPKIFLEPFLNQT